MIRLALSGVVCLVSSAHRRVLANFLRALLRGYSGGGGGGGGGSASATLASAIPASFNVARQMAAAPWSAPPLALAYFLEVLRSSDVMEHKDGLP